MAGRAPKASRSRCRTRPPAGCRDKLRRMPRYEFSEGSSNKFWEIELSGSSFTTKHGKIGTSGQTLLKDWPDAATAKKEYDKLIAQKTKKGYTLVGGGEAKSTKA